MMLNYPRSFQFAERFLISPENMSASADQTPAFQTKNTPDLDQDKDGIINKLDNCSNTPEGAEIRRDEKYYGCSKGQYKDYFNVF